MNKGWLYVITGGIVEIFWVLALKLSHQFTVFPYNIIALALVITSFTLFSKGMNRLPSGIAYTAFTGIGAIGTLITGIIFLDESVSVAKLTFSLILIMAIIGLKVTSEE